MPPYRKVSKSWVAQNPAPLGVVEFYGGEFFGGYPRTFYSWLLDAVYGAGYTLIVVPFQTGLDHWKTACALLEERDAVRAALPELDALPHFWLGHSVGCKIILLLEAATDPRTGGFVPPGDAGCAQPRRGILHEPSVLMAPVIGSTKDAVRIPCLARWLNRHGEGVNPSPAETYRMVEAGGLFRMTGMLAFTGDTIAGTAEGPRNGTVHRLYELLESRAVEKLLYVEQPGVHLQPVGGSVLGIGVGPALTFPADKGAAAPLQQAVVSLLAQLGERRAAFLAPAGAAAAEW